MYLDNCFPDAGKRNGKGKPYDYAARLFISSSKSQLKREEKMVGFFEGELHISDLNLIVNLLAILLPIVD